jgi:hypothetical protein
VFSNASNYPAGVTDAHPHFNPVESVMEVKCEDDETEVVPTHELKEELGRLEQTLRGMVAGTVGLAMEQLPGVLKRVTALKERVEELEDVSNWECTFEGDVEVQITDNGATAEWTCPVCANPHSENIGEDDDPDRARDEAYDRKFD